MQWCSRAIRAVRLCPKELLWGGPWVRGVCGWGDGSEWVHCSGSRTLGGEAERSPRRSLGTSLLLPSGSFKKYFCFPSPCLSKLDTTLPQSRPWRRQRLGCAHRVLLLPLIVGTVIHKAGDGSSTLQKQDPPPRLSFCPWG